MAGWHAGKCGKLEQEGVEGNCSGISFNLLRESTSFLLKLLEILFENQGGSLENLMHLARMRHLAANKGLTPKLTFASNM